MDREEFRRLLIEKSLLRQRWGSPGAVIRGWRIDFSRVLNRAEQVSAASCLLREISGHLPATVVAGILRSGGPLAAGIASIASAAGSSLRTAFVAPSFRTRPATPIENGDLAIVVDDIINSGWTARRAIRNIEAAGAKVLGLACLVRYSSEKPLLLRDWDRPIFSVFGLEDLGVSRFRPH